MSVLPLSTKRHSGENRPVHSPSGWCALCVIRPGIWREMAENELVRWAIKKGRWGEENLFVYVIRLSLLIAAMGEPTVNSGREKRFAYTDVGCGQVSTVNAWMRAK